MSGTSSQVEKSIGEQVADLLRRKPQNYDVIFSVGPQKEKVEAVKIFLKAASPVFERKFEQNWDNALAREGDVGIPLPHFEPSVFKLFVHLIISDTWSVEALKNLNLPPNTILSLLGLCRHYKITKAIENLENAAADFIQNFQKFKDTPEFLKISRKHLETVLSCEQLPLNEKELFQSVCKILKRASDFAKVGGAQCQQKGTDPTGENFREVLGSCLREIRFPTMNFEEFAKISSFKQNLFTAEEIVAIFQFIGADKDQRAKYDKSQLPFKTKPRGSLGQSLPFSKIPLGCSVLRLPSQFKITQNPPFICDGKEKGCSFKVNQKISLHGVGFLGPIEGDTWFDFTVRILRFVDGSYTFYCGTLKKNIVAQKGNIFYFLFDAPITIEPNAYDSNWQNFVYIEYSLKGANHVPMFKVEKPKDECVLISGVGFNLRYTWNSGSPLAELLFKQI